MRRRSLLLFIILCIIFLFPHSYSSSSSSSSPSDSLSLSEDSKSTRHEVGSSLKKMATRDVSKLTNTHGSGIPDTNNGGGGGGAGAVPVIVAGAAKNSRHHRKGAASICKTHVYWRGLVTFFTAASLPSLPYLFTL